MMKRSIQNSNLPDLDAEVWNLVALQGGFLTLLSHFPLLIHTSHVSSILIQRAWREVYRERTKPLVEGDRVLMRRHRKLYYGTYFGASPAEQPDMTPVQYVLLEKSSNSHVLFFDEERDSLCVHRLRPWRMDSSTRRPVRLWTSLGSQIV